MDKKGNAIYAPGELDRVRGKLGEIDQDEAKRMAQLLGGEVGYEREAEGDSATQGRLGKGRGVAGGGSGGGGGSGRSRPRRSIELAGPDEEESPEDRIFAEKLARMEASDPLDDPSLQLNISYSERLKMDRCAAQPEFSIKNSFQVLISMFTFFGEPADNVSTYFVNRRMSEHYRTIEQLVTATRALFPRNNVKRNDRVKKTSPFVYNVLDTIRYWNIETIGSIMARIQAHPRSVRVAEFADILRAVYRPLFILDQLDMETHINAAYKLLAKVLYIENPSNEFKEKNQTLTRNALAAFSDIRRGVRFSLYPLLMKLISDRWFPYERIFIDRHRRYMAFLNVTERDQIKAVDLTPQQVETGDLEALKEDPQKEEEAAAGAEPEKEEDPTDPEVIARKAQEAKDEAEQKALDHSLRAMEAIFPQAGWNQLAEFPDLYPYFSSVYDMRRGFELIPPTDALQQVATLMHIMGDLCVALRYVNFGMVIGPDGHPAHVEEFLREIINSWFGYVEEGFSKQYLPRLTEYCRLLENSGESRISPYAKRSLNELHWLRRLYFLPYYKFESIGPPPFQKQETKAIYSEVRTIRKYLASVAIGIEHGSRQGGAGTKVHCDGINNPWEPYKFEIPNPVSRRLNALLSPAKRNNASIVFFALAASTILDNIVNSEASWAYGERPGPLFRSVNGEGVTPIFGIDDKVDADKIFKETMKQKAADRAKRAEEE